MKTQPSISLGRHNLIVLEEGATSEIIENGLATAEIGKEIRFDPNVLDSYDYKGWQSIHRDFMLVCAAVEFADRRFERPKNQWARQINITVPVMVLEVWQKLEVKRCLADVLSHLTGDDWCFSFVKAENQVAIGHRQRSLPFENRKQIVMAYSEGLDSRAVAGLFDEKNVVIRVRLSNGKEKVKRGERPFDVIPFDVKPPRSRESGVRSRGFKFAAITAIAGHISNVSRIIVPESGQGALGPVLAPLHNVYADYRNHPTFFRKMEMLIATLLEFSVTYEQPRLWYTKGQTVLAFLEKGGGETIGDVVNTRSCWQQRWNVRGGGDLRQCGICAACLLRRMSLHAAGVSEEPGRYTFADLSASKFTDAVLGFSGKVNSNLMAEYASVGARHLDQLAEFRTQPDLKLRQHAFEISQATGESEQGTIKNLRMLLMQHAEEWHDFVRAQGKGSFLKYWTKGSIYGGYK